MTDLLAADLPVAGVLQEAVVASRGGAVVVTAPPGSGKTMLVPAAILDDLPFNLKVVLIRLRQTVRPDLRVIVMSATLAAEPVAKLLGDCPVVCAEGRPFPVQIRYERRGEKRPLPELVASRVPDALRETTGHVLIFLPG